MPGRTGNANAQVASHDTYKRSENVRGRDAAGAGQSRSSTPSSGGASSTAANASIEAHLLARADVFVGKFSSNLFRAAYSLRAAHCDCVPLFASLDAPMCFDYGLRSGRNWEFPLANASAGRPREASDATFEC